MNDQQKIFWKHFMNDQAEEIMKHNWIESEKAGKDVSIISGLIWVKKYAKKFKKKWLKKHPNEMFC